jgi:glycosyltransferase involved in cell wall biosynthesis
MKILHVIDTLNIGGAENVCLNIITMLIDAGHQSDCVVISVKGPLFDKIDQRATAIFLNRKNKFSLCTMWKFTLIASRYDLVHVHMRHTWVYVKLSSILFNRRLKLIFHDHYWKIETSKDATYRLKGIFKPTYYIGISNEHIKWANRFLKIGKRQTYLLANTIIPRYNKSEKYHGEIIMVSNLRSVKNIHFGITLANTLQRKLTIFGNHDGSKYADGVVQAVKESDYAELVQNETDIQQYLDNFQFGIHTSFSETGPLVLLEYLAHGLPFITADCGPVVNQIREELPGFIATSFNKEEWIHKIELLELENKIHRDNRNRQLRDIFTRKFSHQDYLEQCLEIYQNVLTSS